MTMSDYPDWVRVDQWVGSPLVYELVSNIATGTTFGPFYVAPWEAVSFALSLNGGALTALSLDVRFYADQALTQAINFVTYTSVQSKGIVDVVPVQSLYCTVTVGGYAGVRSINLFVLPRRGDAAGARMHPGGPLIEAQAFGFPAGASLVGYLSPVCACTATFTAQTNANIWTASLVHENTAGVQLGTIAVIGSAPYDGYNVVTVDLPPGPVSLRMANGDGVARNLFAAVVPRRG